MRCTQLLGLTHEAIEFLQKEIRRTSIVKCPTCGHERGGEMYMQVYDEETGVKAGMFDDGPHLNEYQLKGSKVVREVVQAVSWSSGPCIFLCLEDNDGNRLFEWSQEDIDHA